MMFAQLLLAIALKSHMDDPLVAGGQVRTGVSMLDYIGMRPHLASGVGKTLQNHSKVNVSILSSENA